MLLHLKEDYGEEVLREFKKLVSSLINEMGARQYKKATECVFLLRDLMDEGAWEKYVKALYLGHSGKRNLWSEFNYPLNVVSGSYGINVSSREFAP